LSQALNDEHIGLEQIADGLWNILYYDTLLGRFDEETTPSPGPHPSGKSVTYVPGHLCYPSSRLFTSLTVRRGAAACEN
jgi:hypothetical protein